jgi:hypothetical protein
MLEPSLVLGYRRSLQGSRAAQRYLHCCDQLQQGLGTQTELLSTGNGRNHRSTAIRPLHRHPHEPTPWMLHINVLLPILAPDGADHRQALAS